MMEVIKVNVEPEAKDTVTTIPPGFQPMPKMVTVPILGYTADIKPITAKEPIEGKVSDCAVGCKKKTAPHGERGLK